MDHNMLDLTLIKESDLTTLLINLGYKVSLIALIIYENEFIICKRSNSFNFSNLAIMLLKYDTNISDTTFYKLYSHMTYDEKQLVYETVKLNKDLFSKYFILYKTFKHKKLEWFCNINPRCLVITKFLFIIAFYCYMYYQCFIEEEFLKANINNNIDTFVLPGGKFSNFYDNNIISALLREVKEETNITLNDYEIENIYKFSIFDEITNTKFNNILFVINVKSLYIDTFIPNFEINKIYWKSFSNVLSAILDVYYN